MKYRYLLLLAILLGVALWVAGRHRDRAGSPVPVPVAARGGASTDGPSAHSPLPGHGAASFSEPGNGAGASNTARIDPPAEDAPFGWLLQFYDTHDAEQFMAVARSLGIDGVRILPGLNVVKISVPDAALRQRLLAEAPTPLRRVREVALIEPPPPPKPPPGATYYGVYPPGTLAWFGLSDRPSDWGQGVKVAVLDTPVDASHPQLSAADIRNGVSHGGADPGHGTQMASVIVNNDPREGIAPGATLISVPVMSAEGKGTSFDLAEGIVKAVDQGASVLNVSLGMYGDSPAVAAAVEYAVQAGAVVVASAGNDGTDEVLWPARYDSVLAVGAVDAAGQPAYFSNSGSEVDLVAPGVGVPVAGEGNGSIMLADGTSASAAVVSGILAGLLSDDPTLTPAEAAELLVEYANDTGVAGPDPETGAGVADPERVLERDEPGIVDIAVGTAHISTPDPGGDLVVAVAVQNRGTEPVATVRLTTTIGDTAPQSLLLYDFAPTVSRGHTFRVPASYLPLGPVAIRYEALIVDGGPDARPANNIGSVTVGLSAAE